MMRRKFRHLNKVLVLFLLFICFLFAWKAFLPRGNKFPVKTINCNYSLYESRLIYSSNCADCHVVVEGERVYNVPNIYELSKFDSVYVLSKLRDSTHKSVDLTECETRNIIFFLKDYVRVNSGSIP